MGRGQQTLQGSNIRVWYNFDLRPGKTTTIDNAGMILRITKDRVGFQGQLPYTGGYSPRI